jgi:hypothetical protein
VPGPNAEALKYTAEGDASLHLGLIYQQMKLTGVSPQPEEESGKGSKGYLETWSLREESAGKNCRYCPPLGQVPWSFTGNLAGPAIRL